MKLKLSPLISDIFILVYIAITLYIRFKLENQIQLNPLLSIFIGLIFVLFIWALIKVKVLNPNWFGLFNSKK